MHKVRLTINKQGLSMPYTAGKSGNPKGRPKGKGQSLTAKRKALSDKFEELGPEQLEKIIAYADKEKCIITRKYLLDKAGQFKPETKPVVIEGFDEAETAEEQAKLILGEASSGSISIDVATSFLDLIKAAHGIAELNAMQDDIERLKQLHEQQGLRAVQ
jgi:hypothetical protein